MRIVWINDYATFSGGAENYIFQTAQTLAQQYDVENILLYSVNNHVDYTYSKVFTFSSVIADIGLQLEYLKPDIIYVHQVSDTEVLKSLLNTSIPTVSFIHDHKHFCLREHKYTTIGHQTCTKAIGAGCYSCLGFINKENSFPYISINSLSKLKKVQEILKNFNHVVVASEYMKAHLIQHHFSEERLSKIPLFSKPITLLEQDYKETKEKRFLFVGQLVRGKGVDTLLEAFAILQDDDVYLDICGEGKQREELEYHAQKLGLLDKVVFHGKLTAQELSSYYSKAYAVVIPSRAPETFNLVGLEAMKHTKAVIAADVGGIQEWLEEGKTGYLFPSNNVMKLASLLKKASHTPQQVAEMGKAGLIAYNTRFTPEKHCDRLYTLFHTLLKKDYHAA
jgi:glycosyltransferase involved in cell wall biosynthesis